MSHLGGWGQISEDTARRNFGSSGWANEGWLDELPREPLMVDPNVSEPDAVQLVGVPDPGLTG